jgi:AraC-like DNA-binding protein
MAVINKTKDKTLYLLNETMHAWGIKMEFYDTELHGIAEFDGGIRSRLFQNNDAADLMTAIRKMPDGTVTMLEDFLYCRYCLFRLPEKYFHGETGGENENSAMRYGLIGPWLINYPDAHGIDTILLRYAIPVNLRQELVHYYEWVPPVSTAVSWGEMLLVFIKDLYETTVTPKIHTVFLNIGNSMEYYPKQEAVFSMKILETRYKTENAYLAAITRGDGEGAIKALANFRGFSGEERIPKDRLRGLKNYLIVLNTLMRKAAEQGEVHPVHIDAVSSDYSREIEALTNISEITRIVQKMLFGYCELVNKYSMQGYTPVIRDVINFIEYHVQEPLSLHYLAERFNINPSYLSTLFKHETGETLTNFINNSRMRFVARLLRNPAIKIQDAAEKCGFLDINYFNRIFKRFYGKTPRDFRRDLNKPGR